MVPLSIPRLRILKLMGWGYKLWSWANEAQDRSPAEDSERIYLMAWLAGGCDLFSCHIAFFLLPPFSSLLPLLHINQRSMPFIFHLELGHIQHTMARQTFPGAILEAT